jgi:hypothetical protein
MNANTAYSIELNAMHRIAGWDQPVRVALEQNGIYDGKTFNYLDNRQTKIIPISFN